jgi:phage terminase large subunit-like protein
MPSIEETRVLAELERRKRVNPLAFIEAPNEKIAKWWCSTAKVRAIFGGNRSSKTESACIDVLWHIRGEHPFQEVKHPPVSWRCEVSDYIQLDKVVLPKIRKLCPPSLYKGGSFESSWNDRKHIMTFSNGSKLDFVTHDQHVLALEGASLDGFWSDEECPKDHFVSNVMRTVDNNGRVVLSLTPLQGMTWVYDDIYLKSMLEPKGMYCVVVSIYENKFLSQEAIQEVEELITDETDREIRLMGKFRPLGGLVFRKFDPDIHVYREEDVPEWWDNEYPPDEYYKYIIGIDPGWDHPTGVIWLAIDPDEGDHWFCAEYKESGLLPEEHAETIFEQNEVAGIYKPSYVIDCQANAKDGNGNALIKDYQKAGIHPALGSKKLLAGNQHLDRLMAHTTDPLGTVHTKFHVSVNCGQFIHEIMTYQRKPTPSASGKEQYVDKNNDLISAARYAAWKAKYADYSEQLISRRVSPKKRLRTGY